MNIHTNARLTPRSREALVLASSTEGSRQRPRPVAFAVSERTARKWMARFRAEGMAGLADRSSRPRRSPRQIPPGPNRGRSCAAPTAQRRLLHLKALCSESPGSGPAPPLHPPVHSSHQWQSRTLYPNLSAGMGLRSHLSTLHRPCRLSPHLPPPLQLASSTLRSQPPSPPPPTVITSARNTLLRTSP